MVAQYKREIEKKDDPDTITALPPAKRGRSTLLPTDIDTKLQKHITAARRAGAPINRRITVATAYGLVRHHKRHLLPKHGGHLNLEKGWATSFLRRVRFVRRKATKAARKHPPNYEELQSAYHERISTAVSEFNPPDELIINIDQTGVPIVPVGDYTLEEEGAKQVPIVGKDDKRQITVVLGETHSCQVLPPQVIYQGKTDKCHPQGIEFPDDWDITHTDNHWSTGDSMVRWVKQVLEPHVQTVRKQIDSPDQRGILILDVFKAHQCTEFLDAVRSHNMEIVFVPGGCTDDLQPLDVSGNKVFKTALADHFSEWYTSQVVDQLEAGDDISSQVDLRLALLKPLHANWMIAAYDHLRDQRDALATGWRKPGLTQCILDARSSCVASEEPDIEVTRL